MKPQTKKVRAYLKQNGAITPMHAFKYMGIYRLASRICELRKAGMSIITKQWKTARGNRKTKYVLEGSE